MNTKTLVLTEKQLIGQNAEEAGWQVVLAYLGELEGEERAECARRLPPHWRAVYTCILLEYEVLNGGHHQYFWNTTGALNKETLEDLRFIGAGPFVSLFGEAVLEFHHHNYLQDKAEAGPSWEVFVKPNKEKRMDELDRAFCKEPKTIAMYLSDFIRSHRELYANPAADGSQEEQTGS